MALSRGQQAALARMGAATLGESGGASMAASIRPAWVGATVVGEAWPVRCAPGDNLAIHVAVADAPAGSVLVVQIEGEPERGYWGEILTTAAETRAVVGLVIEGGVRDVAALEGRRFPAFATMVALRGATKSGPGAIGSDVVVGGVAVRAGDAVVADVDGVTVVPSDRLDEVMAAAQAREANERELFEKLRAGGTTVELLGLDPSPIERPAPPA